MMEIRWWAEPSLNVNEQSHTILGVSFKKNKIDDLICPSDSIYFVIENLHDKIIYHDDVKNKNKNK